MFIWVVVAAAVKHELTSDTEAENSSTHFLSAGSFALEHRWFIALYKKNQFTIVSAKNDHLLQPQFRICIFPIVRVTIASRDGRAYQRSNLNIFIGLDLPRHFVLKIHFILDF